MNATPPAPLSGTPDQSRWVRVGSYLWWPLLFATCSAMTAWGLAHHIDGSILVAVEFLGLAGVLELLERHCPHEPRWNQKDGQLRHDVVFTLIGSGLPGAIAEALVIACVTGAAQWLARHSNGGLWPSHWPLLAQVVLTLLIADFGGYWAHRLNHTVSWLWPYHAVHHWVPRLYWLNSGRAHPFDTAMIVFATTPVLYLLGAPEDMMVWVAATTSVIGTLSHCNVNMRCGVLDWIFNTPNVHRWHHSRVLAEGNRNYGENTMVWDVLFGTHYRHTQRRPPLNVGTETALPKAIVPQFLAPLRMSRAAWRARRMAIDSDHPEMAGP